MDVLLPGRFDPLHRGHWLLVYDMLGKFQQVIVGIRNTQDGSFQADERFLIALRALEGIGRCTVVLIDDLDQCQTWIDKVRFDAVVTANDEVKRAAGEYYEVIEIDRHGDYSATEIRERLAQGQDIGDLIIPDTARLIQEFWLKRRYGQRTT